VTGDPRDRTPVHFPGPNLSDYERGFNACLDAVLPLFAEVEATARAAALTDAADALYGFDHLPERWWHRLHWTLDPSRVAANESVRTWLRARADRIRVRAALGDTTPEVHGEDVDDYSMCLCGRPSADCPALGDTTPTDGAPRVPWRSDLFGDQL
jgi:hypothetical protein